VQDAKAKQKEVVTERACSTKETHLLDLPDLAAAQPCGVHMETVSATPSTVVNDLESRQVFFFSFFRKNELKRTTREPRFHELVSTRWGWRARTSCRADIMRPRVYKEISVYLFLNAVD
jgi:hypothetical protein